MTQNEKDLLLKDLCARLPYGVKFPITWPDPITSEPIETIGTISSINRYGIVSFVWDYEGQEILVKDSLHIQNIKPYLFPFSSMTEKQKQELDNLVEESVFQIIHSEDGNPQPQIPMDWYNKNHFDYRDLIEEGLVNDATGKNIY